MVNVYIYICSECRMFEGNSRRGGFSVIHALNIPTCFFTCPDKASFK